MDDLQGRRVLFVITKSNWGGAQAYVHTLATRFAQAGADVAVASGGTGEAGADSGLLVQKLAEAGIRTIFVRNFMRDISYIQEWKALGELTRIFKRERPDVVHLNSSKAGGIGALAARLAGVSRIVFTAHGLPFDEDVNLASRIFRWLSTWATFLLAHRVIVISQANYRRARRFPFCARKPRLVYNGVAEEPLAPREMARAALMPEADMSVPWIGTISELTRNKGLGYLIDAAKLLDERGCAFELGVIGTGEEYGPLTRQIEKYGLQKKVRLLGFIADAARYLSAFDIFTLTSVKEGHPYVLLEAARARCAIVASRISGIMDIVDNTAGFLVAPKDSEAIASALETLLTDSRRRQELGANLSARVAKNFSIERMLAETATAYLPAGKQAA
ncbi:glycosyltransferase family 4 protein [Candidatus Kaiserbacteria bacterium]|nr:glycosyltransferase family 4 protein [Candidatus Kaiserbacteria bacterium]